MQGKVTFDLKNMTFSAEGDDVFVQKNEDKFLEIIGKASDFIPNAVSQVQSSISQQPIQSIVSESIPVYGSFVDDLCTIFGCSFEQLQYVVKINSSSDDAEIVISTKTYSTNAEGQIDIAFILCGIAEAKKASANTKEIREVCKKFGVFDGNFAANLKNYSPSFLVIKEGVNADISLTMAGKNKLREIAQKAININVQTGN